MKAIVMIDMPTKCSNCQLVEEWFTEYGEEAYYCPLHRMTVPKNGDVCKELRPLPEKKNVEVKNIEDIMHTEFLLDSLVAKINLDADKLIALGWNSCVDEILGEKE